MQKLWLLALMGLALQASASRVKARTQPQVKREEVQQVVEQAQAEEVEQTQPENDAVDEPEDEPEDEDEEDAESEQEAEAEDSAEDKAEAEAGPYYYNHVGEWEDVIPEMKKNFTQIFKVKERIGFFVKKYRATLEKELDDVTQKTSRRKIRARVMEITNYFWTMHAHQEALFKNEQGVQIGDYTMYNPRYFSRRWTWRVAKTSDMDKVLFTIQKRLYSDHCKFLGWFSCRPVLKIYLGHRGDKTTLIYYGVGDKDLEEPDFKFYHARDEYKMTRHKWVAKVDHKKTKSNGAPKGHALETDEYKVIVKANKDAALLLLATACLDVVGDETRSANAANQRRIDAMDD